MRGRRRDRPSRSFELLSDRRTSQIRENAISIRLVAHQSLVELDAIFRLTLTSRTGSGSSARFGSTTTTAEDGTLQPCPSSQFLTAIR